jgi:hypothetical protein
MRNEYNVSVGGDHLQDQEIDGMVTLKMIVKTCDSVPTNSVGVK